MKVATASIAQFAGVTSIKLAAGSVRRRKLAADDREIDFLPPFGAAGMRHDVPNFVAVQGQGRGVGLVSRDILTTRRFHFLISARSGKRQGVEL